MSNKTLNIDALLEESRVLAREEKALKEKLRAKKKAISQEFTQNIDDATREKLTNEIQKETVALNEEVKSFKQKVSDMKSELKERKDLLKEKILLVNYMTNSTNGIANGKVKNQIALENGIATINREGFPEVASDTSNPNWQKELKAKMIESGFGDSVARNVCYKISCMVKSNS